MRFEWAKEVDDILWRRSKKGLVISKDRVSQLDEYIAAKKSKCLASSDDESDMASTEERITRSLN